MASTCKLSLSVVTSKEPKVLPGSYYSTGTEASKSSVMGQFNAVGV